MEVRLLCDYGRPIVGKHLKLQNSFDIVNHPRKEINGVCLGRIMFFVNYGVKGDGATK